MFADKYPSTFSRQMEAIVYIYRTSRFLGSTACTHWIKGTVLTNILSIANNTNLPFFETFIKRHKYCVQAFSLRFSTHRLEIKLG